MSATASTRSKSRNVNAYVKAERRHRELVARLLAKEQALDPLRAKVRAAGQDVKLRHAKLTGGQMAEALRILATPGA